MHSSNQWKRHSGVLSVFPALALLCCSTVVLGQDKLAPPGPVQLANGNLVDVKNFEGASPAVGDFNRDGKLDLLVGDRGKLRIYLNRGTAKNPKFNRMNWLKVDGVEAEVPGGGHFRPQLVDLNGDGMDDILTVSGIGLVSWFQRVSKDKFEQPQPLLFENGEPLLFSSDAACFAADWDADADKDIVLITRPAVDSRQAEAYWIENVGTKDKAKWSQKKQIMVKGQVIRLKGRTGFPVVADWNGDGRDDLMVGHQNGQVTWYANVAESGEATRLRDSEILIPRTPVNAQQLINEGAVTRGHGARIAVADWNGDGRLDLLVGDRQYRSVPPKGVGEAKKRMAQIRKESQNFVREYRRLRKPIGQETDKKRLFRESVRDKIYAKIAQARRGIAEIESTIEYKQDVHGYVWLFVTK